jgi:hypothetical protein
MLIISETKNGNAYPYSVFECCDVHDFIQRVRDTQLQSRSDDTLVETTEQACAWLDERSAQYTQIITQEMYTEGGDSWPSMVDRRAQDLGWKGD